MGQKTCNNTGCQILTCQCGALSEKLEKQGDYYCIEQGNNNTAFPLTSVQCVPFILNTM